MPERSISLTAEQAAFVDRLIASGAYATAGEVVEAGLAALHAQAASSDAGLERWLREEVLPVYDAVERGEEDLLTADEVRASLARHQAARRGA
ncbi:MAG: type II toxin-antitoxin system ParD family antitoxin [Acetobacteraceae bacterium]|nr:type II toxin-antitoxin system ParD family antitoxin [Acetobacteraceae bacterium]